MIRSIVTIGVFFAALFTYTISPAQAQLSLTNNSANLEVAPAYPEPHTEVTLTLNAYAYDQLGSSIAWYINGIEDVTKKNKREIEIEVGDYTDTTEVIARLTLADNTIIDTKRSITPTRVDIIIEADTLVPLFYKGRALPSTGSTIRAVAIPVSRHLPSELSYSWSLDNKSIHAGPLQGQDTAEFSLPYGGEATLSVEVSDPNGRVFAKKIVRVYTADSEMHFYETNSLRGISRTALQNRHQLIADEITVRAEPYYVSKDIFAQNVHAEWKINGISAQNPSNDPQNITLRKEGNTGLFKVSFHVRNLKNLLQGIQEDFTLAF